MALSYAQLISPMSKEDIEQGILDVLELAGFPVTAWQSGSAPRTLIQAFASVSEDAWLTIGKIARGVVYGTSKGLWLDALGLGFYNEARKDPVSTVVTVRLTDHGGGPYTVTAGAFIVGTSNGKYQYRAITGGTLPLGGVLDISVQAVQVGQAYNVGIGQINTLVTSLPTVTCSNLVAPSIYGADTESDDVYSARLPLKWGTLSTGSPVPAYEFWALSWPGVSRTYIDDRNPDGANSLRVYVDASGAVTGLQNFLQPGTGYGKAPAGTKVTVVAATQASIVLPLTISVKAGQVATAQPEIEANLTAYADSVRIGGTVVQASIVEAVMTPANVYDVTFSGTWTGTPNVALGTGQVPVFDLTQIVYVEV